jgi:hypothetical protein
MINIHLQQTKGKIFRILINISNVTTLLMKIIDFNNIVII